MKVTIKIKKEVEVIALGVDAGVRYWEDATVNGVEDTEGNLIPCREGDRWRPIIDIESGMIVNWTKGVKARVHYKVCDDGIYHLLDGEGNSILIKDGYVPDILDVERDSYGDYIIMNIDENGLIADWNKEASIEDFYNED